MGFNCMDLESILMERIHAKFVKYNGVMRASVLEVPISDDFAFFVSVLNDKITVELGTLEYNHWKKRSEVSGNIDKIIIKFEPARPTFDPEMIIKNLVEMYRSILLAVNKFYKYAKIINKNCGNIPIHGKR